MQKPVLIFDGHCGFCTSTMRFIKRLDRWNRLDVAPGQDAAIRDVAGLTVEQSESAAWLVLPDGTRYRGAGAAWAAVAVALPIFGDILLAVYHLPLIRPIQDAGYRWVARNRGHFPGGPAFLEENS